MLVDNLQMYRDKESIVGETVRIIKSGCSNDRMADTGDECSFVNSLKAPAIRERLTGIHMALESRVKTTMQLQALSLTHSQVNAAKPNTHITNLAHLKEVIEMLSQ